MAYPNDEWQRKGATLSDKTAPWGASIRLSRCSALVFVDQPAKPVTATNALSRRRRWRTHSA